MPTCDVMKEDLYTVYISEVSAYMMALATTCKEKGDMSGFDRYFALYESVTDTILQYEDEHTGTDMCFFVWVVGKTPTCNKGYWDLASNVGDVS